jgi:hypothetical protein
MKRTLSVVRTQFSTFERVVFTLNLKLLFHLYSMADQKSKQQQNDLSPEQQKFHETMIKQLEQQKLLQESIKRLEEDALKGGFIC